MKEDLDALFAQLEKYPHDWDTYRILADWYEENGEQSKADAVRWQVENKRRPRQYGDYRWYNAAIQLKSNISPYSDIGEAHFRKMANSSEHMTVSPTRRKALELLYDTFHLTTEEDRVIRYEND